MYVDKALTCVECDAPFSFTTEEQTYHAQKGYTNEPKRCPTCRAKRRAERDEFASGPRQLFSVTCAQCGQAAQVPFQPRGDKPVYCNDCYRTQRQSDEQARSQASDDGYGSSLSHRDSSGPDSPLVEPRLTAAAVKAA